MAVVGELLPAHVVRVRERARNGITQNAASSPPTTNTGTPRFSDLLARRHRQQDSAPTMAMIDGTM